MRIKNDAFLNETIYSALVNQIYHHYQRDLGIQENHTTLQKQEQFDFIAKLGESPVIVKLHDFLVCKCKLSMRFTGVAVHRQKLKVCFSRPLFRNTQWITNDHFNQPLHPAHTSLLWAGS